MAEVKKMGPTQLVQFLLSLYPDGCPDPPRTGATPADSSARTPPRYCGQGHRLARGGSSSSAFVINFEVVEGSGDGGNYVVMSEDDSDSDSDDQCSVGDAGPYRR